MRDDEFVVTKASMDHLLETAKAAGNHQARESLARYFGHLGRAEIGVIKGFTDRDLYEFLPSWIRNRLDEKWAAEADLGERAKASEPLRIVSAEGDHGERE